MGLLGDLIGGYARTRIEDEQRKAEEYLRQGEIYKTIFTDPEADPDKAAMARAAYVNLIATRGGKKGKEALPQVIQMFGMQDQLHQRMAQLAGSQNTDDPGAPGQGEQPSPQEALPVGTGGRSAVTRSGAQPQKPPAFRPLLRTLAGIGHGAESVGRGFAGIPAERIPEAPPMPAELRGNWAMTPEERRQRQIAQWTKEADQLGLTGAAHQEYSLTGKLPDWYGRDTGIRGDVTLLMSDGRRVPGRETKQGLYETLDGQAVDPREIRDVLPKGQVDPKLTGRLAQRDAATRMAQSSDPTQAAEGQAELDYLDSQDKAAKSRGLVAERQARTPGQITPGSEEFQVAQDVAYGDLTFSQFMALYRYSRDENSRLAIYKKARELNPNFSAADFEAGYKTASSPKVRQQLGSLDNAEAGINDLIALSDEAIRTGSPAINKLVRPGGYYIAGGPYSSFDVGAKLFADELSGGLGFGSATDMKLRLGLDVTDGNVSPQDFKNNMEIIKRFIERKRKYTLGQAGPYSQRGPERDSRLPQRPREFDQLISIEDAKKYLAVYGDKDKAMEAAENDGWRVSQR